MMVDERKRINCTERLISFEGEEGKVIQTIGKIAKLIKQNGFKIYMCNMRESYGRISYKQKYIKVSDVSNASLMAIILAHEAGHMLHFVNTKKRKVSSREKREQEAYKRGLKILREFKSGIKEKQWNFYHNH